MSPEGTIVHGELKFSKTANGHGPSVMDHDGPTITKSPKFKLANGHSKFYSKPTSTLIHNPNPIWTWSGPNPFWSWPYRFKNWQFAYFALRWFGPVFGAFQDFQEYALTCLIHPSHVFGHFKETSVFWFWMYGTAMLYRIDFYRLI